MSNQDIGDLCKEWSNQQPCFFGGNGNRCGCLEEKYVWWKSLEVKDDFQKKKKTILDDLLKFPTCKRMFGEKRFLNGQGFLGRVFSLLSLCYQASSFWNRLLAKKQTLVDNWCNRLPEPKQPGLLLARQRCSSCESGSPSDSIESWGKKQLQKMEDRRFAHTCVVNS